MDIQTFHREFTEDFIELYKSVPCLWDVKHKDYSNRKAREKAYQPLIKLQKQIDPKSNRSTVIRKIKSVRRYFLKLKKESERLGKDPTWHFYKSLMFLESPSKQDSNDDNAYDDSSDDALVFQGDTRDSLKKDRSNHNPLSDFKEVKLEYVDTPMDDLPEPLKGLIDPSQVLSIPQSNNSHEDGRPSEGRYTHFGQYVVQEMGRLPQDMVGYCQKLMNDALYLAQLGKLNSMSRIVNDDSENT